MQSRPVVDWATEPDLAAPAIDDWTAGEDLDFVVVTKRERITGPRAKPAAVVPEPTPEPVESATLEVAQPAPVGRRTIAITGRPDAVRDIPRLREIERRRESRGPAARVGSRPDRIVMWAVALGFVLIIIASASARAEAATSLGMF